MNIKKIAALIVGFFAIFILPWFIPLRMSVFSASYTYGFNNIFACLGFFALVIALTLINRGNLSTSNPTANRLALLLFGNPSVSDKKDSSVYSSIFIVTTVFTCALQLAWFYILPFSRFQEMPFFTSRLDLMVLGLKPYLDFQFNYGPAMLYPSYWLYLAAGGKLSIDTTYVLFLTIHWIAGNGLLYYVISNFRGGFSRTTVFLAIFFTAFNTGMGMNYTPLRFLAPIASLLFLHRLFSIDKDITGKRLLATVGSVLLLTLGNLSISPEIGVAAAAGILGYFLSLLFSPQKKYAYLAVLPILSLVIAIFVFTPSYMESVYSFGSGGGCLPLLPTIHIIFYVAIGCWVLPCLGGIALRERNPSGSLALALLIAMFTLVPAAMGHCDPAHIFFNGLGVFIFGLVLLATHPTKSFVTTIMLLYVLIFPVLFRVGEFSNDELLLVSKIFRSATAETKKAEKLSESIWRFSTPTTSGLHYANLPIFRLDLKKLLAYEHIGLPFNPDEDVERFIKLSGRYVPEYYSGYYLQIFTKTAVDRKLDDLSKMNEILVPKDLKDYNNDPIIFRDENDPQVLSQLLLFPKSLIPPPRNTPFLPFSQIMKTIKDQFYIVDEFRNNYIMARRK